MLLVPTSTIGLPRGRCFDGRAILVFREGLETPLVLAAVMASFLRANTGTAPNRELPSLQSISPATLRATALASDQTAAQLIQQAGLA